MTLRSLEFWQTPQFRKFMDDVNEIDRLDLLIIKGTALVQDMVVGIASHRTAKAETSLSRAPLRKVARLALNEPSEAYLLDLILEVAKIRNRPAHAIETTEFVPKFVRVWERVKGDYEWPSDPIHQRDYCQTFFVMLMFELHRAGYGLPPLQMGANEKIDWERHRKLHESARRARAK
ncbi:MAG: hypothetical protein ACYC7A_21425 [Thermoanaerobaculia bacterium]